MIRAKLLEFLANPHFDTKDRIRVVQTMEIMEDRAPFSTPRFQGDGDNECAQLRIWVNSSPSGSFTPKGTKYQEWLNKCPFKKELTAVEAFSTYHWLWK
jgi:hypothetical protein